MHQIAVHIMWTTRLCRSPQLQGAFLASFSSQLHRFGSLSPALFLPAAGSQRQMFHYIHSKKNIGLKCLNMQLFANTFAKQLYYVIICQCCVLISSKTAAKLKKNEINSGRKVKKRNIVWNSWLLMSRNSLCEWGYERKLEWGSWPILKSKRREQRLPLCS